METKEINIEKFNPKNLSLIKYLRWKLNINLYLLWEN